MRVRLSLPKQTVAVNTFVLPQIGADIPPVTTIDFKCNTCVIILPDVKQIARRHQVWLRLPGAANRYGTKNSFVITPLWMPIAFNVTLPRGDRQNEFILRVSCQPRNFTTTSANASGL